MKRVLILGSGLSGMGAASLLLQQSYDVTISDPKPVSQDREQEIANLSIRHIIGPQTPDLLEKIDLLVPSQEFLIGQKSSKLPRPRESRSRARIQIARNHFQGRVIGVTGTNGKSTTVELIAHLLRKLGVDALAVGNVGKTPSSVLSSGLEPEVLVMELSSYQLEACDNLDAEVSVFTSFAPDHLERHQNLEEYFRCKWKLAQQTENALVFSESFAAAMSRYGYCPEKRSLHGSSPKLARDQALPTRWSR